MIGLASNHTSDSSSPAKDRKPLQADFVTRVTAPICRQGWDLDAFAPRRRRITPPAYLLLPGYHVPKDTVLSPNIIHKQNSILGDVIPFRPCYYLPTGARRRRFTPADGICQSAKIFWGSTAKIYRFSAPLCDPLGCCITLSQQGYDAEQKPSMGIFAIFVCQSFRYRGSIYPSHIFVKCFCHFLFYKHKNTFRIRGFRAWESY